MSIRRNDDGFRRPFSRVPSLKLLSRYFGEDAARKIRKELTRPTDAEDGMFNAGLYKEQRARLEECSRLLGLHGVESLGTDNDSKKRVSFSYVNEGDAYGTTLIWAHDSDRIFVSCWGAVVESLERKGYRFD